MTVNSDTICIAALTPVQADALRSVVTLREVDRVNCVPLESALVSLHNEPPALAILETDRAHAALVRKIVSQLPAGVSALVICDAFDEDFFLACHDAGVRDFLVRPLPDSYLVSRVLQALEFARQSELLSKHDALLIELGVLSAQSGVFSTSYFLRLLKEQAEKPGKPGLLLLEVSLAEPLPPETHRHLLHSLADRIQAACRSVDMVGEYMVDKFAVLLPETSMMGVAALADRLRRSLDGFTMIHAEGTARPLIRMGCAQYAGCRHYEDLINQALSDLHDDPTPTGQQGETHD